MFDALEISFWFCEQAWSLLDAIRRSQLDCCLCFWHWILVFTASFCHISNNRVWQGLYCWMLIRSDYLHNWIIALAINIFCCDWVLFSFTYEPVVIANMWFTELWRLLIVFYWLRSNEIVFWILVFFSHWITLPNRSVYSRFLTLHYLSNCLHLWTLEPFSISEMCCFSCF